MRRIVPLACSIALLMLAVFVGSQQSNVSGSTRYCRVRFGNHDSADIIVGRTNGTLLIFRSGRIDDNPERYAMPDDELDDTGMIPPIEAGGATYTITSVSEFTMTEPRRRKSLMFNVTINDGETSYGQYCDVELIDSVDDLPYAHFDGPLAIDHVLLSWKVPSDIEFAIEGEPWDLRTTVGTVDESVGCWTVAETGEGKFPDGVYPTVTVEFPSANSDSPIVKTYPLDQFC